MQDHLPTISLFKPKKSCNRTVMKKELISYVSDLHEYHVTDAGPEQVVRFRISGEQMCDLRNSFFRHVRRPARELAHLRARR